MPTHDLEALMRDKNIIVTDVPHDPSLKFDERSLRTLSPLRSQVSIQGDLFFTWFVQVPELHNLCRLYNATESIRQMQSYYRQWTGQ